MQVEDITFTSERDGLIGKLPDGRFIMVRGRFNDWQADLMRPGQFIASLRNKGNMRIRHFRSPEAAAKNAVKEWASV